MEKRVQIEHLNTGTQREVWTFWYNETYDVLELDYYAFQTRVTKRHGWKTQSKWSRLNYRDSNIKKPAVPPELKERALNLFIGQLVATLKFEV